MKLIYLFLIPIMLAAGLGLDMWIPCFFKRNRLFKDSADIVKKFIIIMYIIMCALIILIVFISILQNQIAVFSNF